MARGMSIFVNIGAKLLPSLNSTATGIEKRFGQMNRKLRVQAAETKLAFKEMAAALGPLAAMAAAGGLAAGLHGIFGEGNEYAHQISQMRNMGRTATEVARAVAQAKRTMFEVPTSTLNDNLKVMNETTMAFGSFAHAAENLSFVQKMEGMLSNVLGEKAGDTGESAYSLIKAMEMRGMGTAKNKGFDSERFQHEAGQFYQASIASGGKVSPQEFFNYVQMANPYMKGMSERYLYRVAPTLIQENGGDRAGTMQNTWTGTILGKAKNKISTEAWMKLGLLDPKQVVYNKVGPVGWKPGAIKGTDLALQDPLKWSESVLIPALRKQGFNTGNQLSLAKALMPLFRDRNANRLANMFVGDQDNARMHKDEGLINKVPGTNAAFMEAMKNDPKMAWAATAASLKNLETIMGKAVTPQVISMLQNMAKAINWLAGVFDAHPGFAKGVVALMGFGAVAATMKVFGIALKWIFSPLKVFGNVLLWIARTRVGGLIANMLIRLGGLFGKFGRFVGPLLMRGLKLLGPLLMRGLTTLGPLVLRGIAMAFGLLSNPIGWAILAASAIALIWIYRKELWSAWKTLSKWFMTKAWPAIRDTVTSINWKSVGMWIADMLTFGLASKLPKMVEGVKKSLQSGDWSSTFIGQALYGGGANPAGPGIAGKRASGGPVGAGGTYLVGERGPELFTPGRSGTIIPHSELQRRRAVRDGGAPVTFNIYGATDPKEVARQVDARLRHHAGGQSALLSD